MKHLTTAELESGLDEIKLSPKNKGTLKLIVRRPKIGERDVLEEGRLDLITGLEGDTWNERGSSRMPDRTPHPDMQLNLINTRAIALIAQDPERWKLAGDQLFVDLNLSLENLPPGTRLSIGSAIIEVTDQPHTGCQKFVERFGRDAMLFVNSPVGRQLNLRGINAKVVQPGVIRVDDTVAKV